MIAVAMYWLLVLGSYERALPISLGPFPTLDVCRSAGRAIAPGDRRFWSIEELAASYRMTAAAEQFEREQVQKQTADKDGWIAVNSCESVRVNAAKTIVLARIDRCARPPKSPEFQILSDCER